MQRPQNVIELGCGYGCVSTILAQALKENEKGKVWCVDNQHDWPLMKEKLKKIGEDHNTYEEYFDYLKNKFNLKDYMEYINITINAESHNFFHVNKPIDLLFSDASDSGPNGCIQTLSFYLPKMSEYADIFIDRASTLNHSFLTLEYIIDNLQKGKIPKILLKFKTEEEINHMYNFVKKSKFTLIHLAESSEKKANRHQNSTAWIKIEPLDVFIGNNVENYI